MNMDFWVQHFYIIFARYTTCFILLKTFNNCIPFDFRHGITPRKSDIIPIQTESKRYLTLRPRQERISLTFRKSITDPCKCEFYKQCPSQSQDKVDEMSDDTASKLEKLHVHEVYEKIADHFSETRYLFIQRTL